MMVSILVICSEEVVFTLRRTSIFVTSIPIHRSANWNLHYQYGKRVYSQTKSSIEMTFYMKSANQKDILGTNKVCFIKNSSFSTRQ